MAHVRQANRTGTAKQLAGDSTGYAADGLGAWTHQHARPDSVGAMRPVRHYGYGKPLDLQIAECERRILKMEIDLLLLDQSEQEKRERLNHDLAIRMRFLTKLLLERDGGL